MLLFSFFSLFFFVNCEYYDTYTGKEITKDRYDTMLRRNLVPWCAIEVAKCDPLAYRRTDLSCNNLHYPSRGASLTPFLRMLPPSFRPDGDINVSPYGRRLPATRRLRTDLVSDGRQPNTRHTHMFTNYLVFYIGVPAEVKTAPSSGQRLNQCNWELSYKTVQSSSLDVAILQVPVLRSRDRQDLTRVNIFYPAETSTVHDTANYVVIKTDCCAPGGATDPMCISIPVPDDDVYLRSTNIRCLNLTTPITYQEMGCVRNDEPPSRLNLAGPMLDLSAVYGTDATNSQRARAPTGGLLIADEIKGKEWPPTGGPYCFLNRQPLETRCHNSSTGGVNSLIGINLVFIWLFRNHNYLARQLAAVNPCWSSDKLYYVAREINIAMANQILYYELLPQLMGHDYLIEKGIIYQTAGHVDDYDPEEEVGVTIDMVTLARWFHVLQEGRYKMYTSKGKLYGEQLAVELTLRTGALAINNTLQGMTQGSFRQPCGARDMLIDPDMSERSLGPLQVVSDVLAADITKGRAMGLPPYNQYRKHCGLKEVKKFDDLLHWMSQESVDVISRSYESPEDIDVFVGILGEEAMPHGVLGETLACVMADQYRRFRRADRFWYEHKKYNPKPFTLEKLSEIRKMTVAKLLCWQGDDVETIQPRAFELPTHGNEMTDCSKLDYPKFDVFREKKCVPDVANFETSAKTSTKMAENEGLFPNGGLQAFLDYIHPIKH